MYLKRIEIQGFKSFPSRTAFEFGRGVTAVIGPNGSGKSNVADAVRWVLGEQSARAMRLRKLEDALFAGGGKRPPAGFAEVSMSLDNSGGWLPVEFAEVTVTRRLHRSGDSEYLLNRRRVRLRDIQELFLKARVGQNSYAIMGQGLVDQVLSLKPEERRALIEEAAEIRRYRLRMEEAQSRLAETRENLATVGLLIAEIAPRLTQLERQARRAREHAALAQELAEALLLWHRHQVREREEALVAARAAYDQRNAAFAVAREEVELLDARLETVRGRLAGVRRSEAELGERARGFAEAARASAQRLKLEEERSGFVRRRLEELETELRALRAERRELTAEAEPAGEPTAADLEAARRSAAEQQQALTGLDAEQERLRRAVADAENVLRSRRTEARDLDDRLAQAERDLARAEQEGPARAQRRRTLLQRLAEYGRAYARRRADVIEAESGAEVGGAALESARADDERARSAVAEADRVCAAARTTLEELTRRRDMLARMRDAARGADGAARALLDGAGKGRALGLLGDLLRVPPGLETAISAALESAVSAVIVADEAAALVLLRHLQEQEGGRVTLLPMDRAAGGAPAPPPGGPGVRGIASELVECEARSRPLVRALLGRCVVVDDAGTALDLTRRHDLVAVTVDGLVAHPNGALTGGRAPASGERFSLERELAALPAALDAARVELDRQRAALDAARHIAEQCRSRLTQAETEAEQSRRVGARARDRLATERTALAPVRGELRESARAAAGDATRIAALREDLARLGHRREELGGRLAEAEHVAAEARSAAQQAAMRRDELMRALAEARALVSSIERERGTMARLRENRRAALARLEERIAGRAREAEARRAELATADADQRRLREETEAAGRALARVEGELAPVHDQARALAREIAELEPLSESRRRALLDLERACMAAETEVQRRAHALEQAYEAAAADGVVRDGSPSEDGPPGSPILGGDREYTAGRGPGQLGLGAWDEVRGEAAAEGRATGGSHRPSPEWQDDDEGVADRQAESRSGREVQAALFGVESALERESGWRGGETIGNRVAALPRLGAGEAAELQQHIRSLRGKIRAIGSVNGQAEEDYRESKERHDALSAQVTDLRAADAGLCELIAELRGLIAERFRTAFQRVGEGFERYFKTFFGGGTAQLLLTEAEDGADPGVEIVARPPGKRLQSLSLLSGGERSMTAVALLFALLETNPAPFCVLDEVDAALDEANVGRFAGALTGLAERTQFIVITHNRVTIQAAGTIYGVSMGADGVSSVLSLRLADIPEE